MKQGERGFTMIEWIVSTAIMALIAGAAIMSTFQVVNDTEQTNDRMIVVRQVENAGYWISRDAQLATSLDTENLTSPDFLILNKNKAC